MKKNWHRYLCILCVLTLVLTLAVPGVSASEFNKDAKNGVVYIRETVVQDVYDGSGNYMETRTGAWRGTAFFIGEAGKDPQYLVTNHHCVAEFLEFFETEPFKGNDGRIYDTSNSIVQIFYGEDDFEEAFVVAFDEKKDLAVLKLEAPTDKRIPLQLTDKTEDLDGTPVYALGFPSSSDRTIDSVHNTGVSDMTLTSGIVSRQTTERATGRQLLQHDAAINNGNSGGPLVDKNGTVLGINTYSTSGDANMFWAVSVSELLPMLRNNNISFGTARVGAVAPEENQQTAQEEKNVAAQAPAAPAEPEKDGSGLTVMLLVAVLVAAVVIVLILRKKKAQPVSQNSGSENTVQSQPMGHTQPVSTTASRAGATAPVQWQLRGVSGELQGKVFPLTGTLRIGRGRNNDVPFSDNAPGISGTHCDLQLRAGSVVLRDLGSSYGTFLKGNVRLQPQVEYDLQPGDTFTLADGAAAFTLERAGAAASGSFVIRSGLDGKVYRGSEQLHFGRNPRCEVRFPENDSAVSSNHCVLYRQQGRLYLVDSGSTNGTFLAQGQRLQPNTPQELRKGDRFYLAVSKYTFEILEG